MADIRAMTVEDARQHGRSPLVTAFFVGFATDHVGAMLLMQINNGDTKSFFFSAATISSLCRDVDGAATLRGWPIAYPEQSLTPTEADWDSDGNMRIVTACRAFAFDDALILALQLEGSDEIVWLRWRAEHAHGLAAGVLHEIGTGRFRDVGSETPPTQTRN